MDYFAYVRKFACMQIYLRLLCFTYRSIVSKKYFLLAKRTHDKNIQKTPRSIYFKNDRNTHISKVILAHTHKTWNEKNHTLG